MIGKVTVRAVEISDYKEEEYGRYVIITYKGDTLYHAEVWDHVVTEPMVHYIANSKPAVLARAKKWGVANDRD